MKTLKDIDELYLAPHGVVIEKEALRQEAIKWMKTFEDDGAIAIFRKFFNITEEDLK